MSVVTAQQSAAISGRGDLLLVAGAGTGKTHTLIARCLRLVIEERVSLENILMVTFTEAAAAEMRGRMRTELSRQLNAVQSTVPFDVPLAEHLAEQAALLDSASISTMHGFCLQLVREYFHELGLDPQFNVLDESQTAPLRREALGETLERHYAGDDERARAVQSLIRTVGRGTDGKIRGLVTRLHAYAQSLPDPAGWLVAQEAYFTAAAPAQWRDLYGAAVGGLRDQWAQRIATGAGNAPALRSVHAALADLPASPDCAAAQAVLRRIKEADAKPNWPRGTIGKYREPLAKFFDDAAFLAELLPAGQGVDPLQEDWDWVRDHMRALLGLVREFADLFAAKKRESPGVDFADLEQCALRVLGNAAIAHEWRKRFAHVFVDEYQDINAAQDAILTALSRTGPEANRFLVGDVKQSIYRFRRANPKIFQAYHKAWSAGLWPTAQPIATPAPAGSETGAPSRGRALSLTENFRSREGLLNFINPLCAALMRREIGGVDYEPLEFGASNQRAALRAKPDDEPCVELHLIARPEAEAGEGENEDSENGNGDAADLLTAEREARLVARRLRALRDSGFQVWDKSGNALRAVCWSDMAVLLRSPGGRAEAFAKEFARAGVPLSAARAGFFTSLEVSDLLCLLHLLDNPLQDLPLAAVLRSPLVGLSAEDLVSVRLARPKGWLWWALLAFLRQNHPAASIANDFVRRLHRWREMLRHMSLSQCLETALVETHYEAQLLAGERGPERTANVRQLLDLARQFDPYQRQGLYRFLRFVRTQKDEKLDREPAPPPVADAVQLVSIHRSKGLEYPVVAFAGLGTSFNERDLNETILLDESLGLCPKITPRGAEQSYPSLTHWLARRHERRELRGEELRLLYVALTRARDRLILVGTGRRTADKLKWAATPGSLDTETVVAARSHLDWLQQWLPCVTREEEWEGEHRGRNGLLTWEIIDGNDERFNSVASDEPLPALVAAPLSFDPDRLADLKSRLEWNYRFSAALVQNAKATVTELRRRAADEQDDESRHTFQTRITRLKPRAVSGLTGAEVGAAVHKFLQHCALDTAAEVAGLEAAAGRLTQLGLLSEAEKRALDFSALARFWGSDCGRLIREQSRHVSREVPFTARMSAEDLRAIDPRLAHPAVASDEFVVVQGVADLVVKLPEEIWLLDFKTDAVTPGGWAAKVAGYTPQLQLYALALARIHRRPVTRCWLHFLANGKTETIRTGTARGFFEE